LRKLALQMSVSIDGFVAMPDVAHGAPLFVELAESHGFDMGAMVQIYRAR
jgi:hypothetical protein